MNINTENFVKKIISEQLNADVSEITSEKRISEDLGVNSLDIVIMVAKAEDELNIRFPDEDIVDLRTVGDTEEYLKSFLENSDPQS